MPGSMPAAASARRKKQKRGRLRFLAWHALAPPTAVMPRACGASSMPRPLGSIIAASGILDRPPQCAIAHKAGDDSWACHCERSEAIHRAAQGKNGLLRGACGRAFARPVWLAMTAVIDARSMATTADMISRSRDMNCPRFASWFALIEKEGAGKTGCALHPRSRVQLRTKNAHTSIQVQRRASGLPCAMVLRRTS